MAEDVTITLARKDLPKSLPIKIVVGDSFKSPIFRHLDANDQPIDTSAWDIPAQLFKRPGICGQTALENFTIEQQPAPGYGYRLTLTDAQTLGLDCDTNYYRIPTNNGSDVVTYFDGPATVAES